MTTRPFITAEGIRKFVYENYIKPAKKSGKRSVSARVGDVAKEIAVDHEPVTGMPRIIQAIDSNLFREQYGLTVKKVNAPKSGQSTTVVFLFQW